VSGSASDPEGYLALMGEEIADYAGLPGSEIGGPIPTD
jgi:hypothetical protein